ncbi:hypothetical protein [Nostoc sp.]|uniref:hypothetical protein n=1 Tax=Nostoc sp. TaxID=1180 RepID=UPI002FF4DA7C
MALNNTVSDAIAKKGGQHTYTFTGEVGQQFFYDTLDGSADLRYSLYDPIGTVLIDGANVHSDRHSNWSNFILSLTHPTKAAMHSAMIWLMSGKKSISN